MKFIRYALLAGALVVASVVGVQKSKEYKFERLKRDFPTYVAGFERQYGTFDVKPGLDFQELPPGELGVVTGKMSGNKVIIDSSTKSYLLGRRKEDVVKHELGHHVAEKIVREVNADWVHFEGDKIVVRDGMEFEAYIVWQGFAEYIAIENGAMLSKSQYVPYVFVKPVLDALGVKNGIKKIILEPPTQEDIYYPLAYYERLEVHNPF